ncbi:uncharacterized protein HMPREF1120_00636 [Exophiala dermatitidis NIH/UT8656]|uniref:Uncharacterized protein n=1 Tax=Exophiala dermatitidis (strain ATCC 34100 / CBS 525.76 / NIH/UT8656) TaxID=858893 RepID=H6BP06_EXODN|nr:uncharacterized protein HMPREF1120_00636 [Exophiala dermatitidis NIH/UT8656]EHY52424.1 hypothetical protein HMPREF1120_00636 [Exophiala dermatitidis NIH/UT8656]
MSQQDCSKDDKIVLSSRSSTLLPDFCHASLKRSICSLRNRVGSNGVRPDGLGGRGFRKGSTAIPAPPRSLDIGAVLLWTLAFCPRTVVVLGCAEEVDEPGVRRRRLERCFCKMSPNQPSGPSLRLDVNNDTVAGLRACRGG